MLRLLLISCVLLGLPAAVAAQAEAAPRTLTSRGRTMLAGQVSGFWSNDRPTLYGSSYPTWTVRADPALTYFVWNNVGIGGALTGSYAQGDLLGDGNFRERALGALAECVWSVPLGGRLSLMLRSSLGYLYSWADLSVLTFDTGRGAATTRQHETRHYLRTAIALPIVYALSASVGLGAGPSLNYDYAFRATREWPDQWLDSPRFQRFRASRLQVGASVAVYASF